MYDLYSFSFHFILTYIIADEIRVIFLNAVIQNGDHYTFSCVTLSPGFFSIQVLMRCVGLKRHSRILFTCQSAVTDMPQAKYIFP